MQNPYKIVKDFEDAVCEYTEAPYCVAVDSCTNAIAICLEWHTNSKRYNNETINIPKHTYISVPVQIKKIGFGLSFRDENWKGGYELTPFNIWDCAKSFTSDMWNRPIERRATRQHKYMCLSFHRTKILGYTQGGAILHDNSNFDKFARQMRFDGRTEGLNVKDDDIQYLGMHCRMDPGVAAELLTRLSTLPKHNEDLPCNEYPDLSQMSIFK